ncbi:hypothetical protein SAMN05216412_11258 [Nitrosospira multiformis]|uniref:Uncharacterized protein n=1 Tax=Nitrosospira multiformis TaxID=1231 RepID=A0A1I0GAK4_9PROT|nr:hypothetical protein SAMN05216412_11258 [Nitrosospira multiformis]
MFHWRYAADAIRTPGLKSGVFIGGGVGKSLGKKRLDTARLPTQTKNSIFQIEFKWQGIEGKKALIYLNKSAS